MNRSFQQHIRTNSLRNLKPLAVRQAKRNPFKNTTTFYVGSEQKVRTHYAVQRVRVQGRIRFFCQCADYHYRKLPHVLTNLSSGCKHVRRVRQFLARRAA